ncbi:MAG: hypothetical protein PSV40_13735 [Polaromonas sp.]|uniref:hypothetical protein n=1 Tax=Polaromonas sp. TaxID=1869339 RepID=UPI002488E422|nr:hypothetical protein [Polaromonas sp.]MDI1270144.1 hypothetical protein [Polaromonas sp.]
MTVQALTLSQVNDGVYRVLTGPGLHVGNLKLIGGQWKFKAIGYGPQGEVIPGGGPLTGRHNTTFAAPDAAVITAVLAPP